MINHLKITVAATMVLTMALLGVPQHAYSQSSGYTGEQIFRGLFFGEAPVGGLFPELWSSTETLQALATQEEKDSWNALKEAVVSSIKQHAPNFMDQFGVAIQSGDPLTIRSALVNASHRTRTAMQDQGYLDFDGNIVPGSINTGTWVAVSVAAVVVAVVAAIAVVTIFNVVKNLNGPGGEGDTEYYRDWLINVIATRLGTA